MTLKPDVCWQLPLRREDTASGDGHVVSIVTQWDRRHWGKGGHDFAWWCTETPDAFCGARPVYESMRDELVGLVGDRVYGTLALYLRSRSNGSARTTGDDRHPSSPVRLPHPAVRRR